MRKILIKHLVLCAVFQASMLLGMQRYCCGTICSSEIRNTLLSNVVKEAFQNENICLNEVFQKFNDRKAIWGVNLLFHCGYLYINRFFPLILAYDGIEIKNKKYVSLQVSDILGFDKEKIIAMQQIKENLCAITMMRKKNLKPSNDYSLQKKLCGLLDAASILDSKFKKEIKDLSDTVLGDIYFCAKNFCEKYANKIADYISSFNKTDGKSFETAFNGKDILLNMQNVCCKPEFRQYAHTEYMLKYQLFNKNLTASISSVSFVSYYDMCNNCESLWAGIANNNFPVKVVSYKEYSSSRSKEKKNGNPHLTLVYS